MTHEPILRLAAALAFSLGLATAAPAQPGARPPVRASAERPVLLLDQIRTPPFPAAWAREFQPLKTLEEVEAVLKAKGAPYQRGRTLLDTRTANAQLVKVIAALPPGEVFILPAGQAATFSRVLQALTPDAAAAFARAASRPRSEPIRRP